MDSTSFGTGNQASYGYASLIAQGISGVIGAFGASSAAKYSNQAAQSYANIARLNAQTMEETAQRTLKAAETSIMKTTMAAGQHKATQRVGQGKSGFAIGAGSNAESLASTDIVKKIDSNQIKSNAVREAGSYRMKKATYLGQAAMAEASKTSSSSAFATSLLSSAGQIGMNYLSMASRGMFDTPGSGSNVNLYHEASYGSSLDGSFNYSPLSIGNKENGFNMDGIELGKAWQGYTLNANYPYQW